MKELLKIRDFMKEMRRPSASSPSSLILFMMALAMMMLAPQGAKADTYNFDWHYWTNGATNAYLNDSGIDTNCSGAIIMSGNNYEGIEGAQTVTRVQYRSKNGDKYSTSKMEVGERLAFVLNTQGKANGYNGNNGWYLRAEPNGNGGYNHRALYTGCWNSKLAVLSLRPGDKVTFEFEEGDQVSQYGAALHYNQSVHCTQGNSSDVYNNDRMYFASGEPISITSSGDLIVDANIGTYITSIKIETMAEATYEIETSADGKTTSFWFTGAGRINENDFAIPYMAVSFGSKNDYLVVGDDLQARMIKQSDNSESLVTDVNIGWQPVAGNFYAFKPTGSGKVTVEGGIQGQCVHLFVYNNSTGGWEGRNNNTYYDTFYTDDDHYIDFEFDVVMGKTYYICINNQDSNESGNAFHLHKFSFENTFQLEKLAKVVDLDDPVVKAAELIELTKINGYTGHAEGSLRIKRCSGNINPGSIRASIINSYLYITKPTFWDDTKDKAGTVVLDINTYAGSAVFVVTFPYHAGYGFDATTGRSLGHTWNFMDPRLSDSNIGDSQTPQNGVYSKWDTTTGILSIGQYKNPSSQLRHETDNREWTYDQRQTGSSGGFHDPMYKNVYDMVGDNADMIWETEGLWFDTETNLSCLYNEKNALVLGSDPLEQMGNPVNFKTLQLVDDNGHPVQEYRDGEPVDVFEDPDRYVGLLPDAGGASSFKIPGLKDGDRVLIFMKSGEATGTNGIFLNVHGALDAEGTPINESDLYKAGGTNWIHSRYEGCYHFIKKDDGDMKFDMVGGSMCKLLYIRIYQGKRIDTNDIVSTKYIPIPGEFDANGKQKYTTDSGHLLFINDKNATEGDYSTLSEHYSGKGQNAGFQVLTYSGNLNASSFTGDYFKISGTYNNLLDFKSKVGEMGVFRLRVKDLTYTYTNDANQNKNYVADLCDRNFTVGYRDKVDYPYTWDFKDVNVFSNSGNNKKIENEATRYVETTNKYENTGWDISLFDEDGYMKVNSGVDPSAENQIFSADKAGFGNQLWADDGVIAETQGLWFYTDDNDPRYNDCLQITDGGIRLANTPTPGATDDPSDNTQRKGWWNYKMVVPSVPAGAAVYLRMKRDETVPANAKSHSNIDNADVYFLASRFNFGVASAAEKTNLDITADRKNQADYSCFKVPGTTDEWIVAIKNTTGAENHLTFTLNGWILEKVAVSLDPKQIGKTGYATESRGRRIDHSLTSYLTGETIKAYTAHFAAKEGSSDTDYSTAVLTRFDNTDHPNMSESTAGQNLGCILYHEEGVADGNNSNRTVGVLDGGFHLFVPDMHDNLGDSGRDVSVTDNVLLAFQPTVGAINFGDKNDDLNYITPTNGSNSNLVLSAKKYKYGTDGSQAEEGYDVFFVRVDPDGNGGKGAFLNKCSAYLQIPTSEMKELVRSNNSKVNIVFDEDFLGNEGVATGVATFAQDEAASSQVYYTLSGVPVSKPTKGGMYIKNGKKVLVK